jgi:hypothetical protein
VVATGKMEEDAWDALSSEEHRSVWDDTERNFWPTFRLDQESWRANAEQRHNTSTAGLRDAIGSLIGRQRQLSDMHAQLTRELAKLEEELRSVNADHDRKSNELAKADQEYREELQTQVDKWKAQTRTMVNFFREKRGQSQLSDAEAVELAATLCKTPELPPRVNGVERTKPVNGQAVLEKNGEKPSESPSLDVIVDAVDADDNFIGPVQRIEPWNQWVDAVLKLPIRRPVKIRRGRRFREDHLATIYDRSEGKGVKWLSCMIQATGEVQSRRCHSCDKNQGAFEQCIIVGGDLLPKCGNCEWNRQGCHGASGEGIDLAAAQAAKAATERESRRAESHELAPIREPLPTNPQPVTQSDRWRDVVMSDSSADRRPTVLPNGSDRKDSATSDTVSASYYSREPVQQLPTPLEPREYPSTSGFTPANAGAVYSRPPSRDLPTPTIASTEQSPQPSNNGEELEEINQANLVLRNNGEVYTYPECVEGVPLVKIDENHPYWDPDWKDVRTEITEARERWKEKQAATIEAEARNEKTGSTKYQIGRQVNRGTKILEFLETGEISPYQLLGKRYMHSSKGGITSYDTLFRLCETLSELSKFNLDVAPVDWMRQRLYELMMAKGRSFNLAKTVHDFYHDPKLMALRSKHGFKNIGRPSGGGRPSLGSVNGGTPRPTGGKRKSMHGSGVSTPRELSFVDQTPLATQLSLAQQNATPSQSQAPDSSQQQQLPKRTKLVNSTPQKQTSAVAMAVRSALPAETFSDTDEHSGRPIYMQDWRLSQVKTRLFSGSTKLTQYWRWKEDEAVIEHYVLKSEKPLEWGTLPPPVDFNVRPDQVAQIFYNVDALRLYVQVKESSAATSDGRPRGDLMAGFKSDRNMLRFLRFCRELKINTYEMSM